MIDTAGRRFSKHPPATRDDLIRQIRRVRFIDPLSAIEPDKTRGGTVWSRDLIVPKRALGGVLKEAAEAETGKRVLRVRLAFHPLASSSGSPDPSIRTRRNGRLQNGSSIQRVLHHGRRSYCTCTEAHMSSKT